MSFRIEVEVSQVKKRVHVKQLGGQGQKQGKLHVVQLGLQSKRSGRCQMGPKKHAKGRTQALSTLSQRQWRCAARCKQGCDRVCV